jgi:hypothetical protein
VALSIDSDLASFIREIQVPQVTLALMEVDALIARLFEKHFGNAANLEVQVDYLEAIFRFATNSLPPAVERDNRIPDTDPRKPTAGRHTLEGDLMWFIWALHFAECIPRHYFLTFLRTPYNRPCSNRAADVPDDPVYRQSKRFADLEIAE